MKSAAWFLPSLLEGSGGHRTILQNARYLVQRGDFRCDLYVENDGTVSSKEELKKLVSKFFGDYQECDFYLGYELQKTYDVLFATAWFTARIVRDIPSEAPKIYFIQDFEALFHPMGDGYLLACNSYCYGLKPITIGRWLTHKMQEEFSSPGQYFDFCADLSVYKRQPKQEKENAVCFVYQPDKPRRCSTIGIEALGIIKYMRPDVKIYLYGSTQKGHIWFEHTNLGIIPIQECNQLYNRCKVGLCISSSNPSRIPFEMMAAGLPVVDIYMENNLYDMPDSVISLAHYTPESIAQAVINVLDHPEVQTTMSKAGITFMSEKNLEHGFEQFYEAVSNVCNGKIPDARVNTKLYNAEPVFADVIKPINGSNAVEGYTAPGWIEKLKRNPLLKKSKLLRKLWRSLKQIFQ